MSQLGRAVAGQAHHRDRAGAQQPEQRHRESAAVGQLQQHPIARCDTHRRQPGRGAIGALVELGEGQRVIGIDHPDMRGPAVRCRRQQRIDGLTGPVTLGSIAGRSVGRKRHKAIESGRRHLLPPVVVDARGRMAMNVRPLSAPLSRSGAHVVNGRRAAAVAVASLGAGPTAPARRPAGPAGCCAALSRPVNGSAVGWGKPLRKSPVTSDGKFCRSVSAWV